MSTPLLVLDADDVQKLFEGNPLEIEADEKRGVPQIIIKFADNIRGVTVNPEKFKSVTGKDNPELGKEDLSGPDKLLRAIFGDDFEADFVKDSAIGKIEKIIKKLDVEIAKLENEEHDGPDTPVPLSVDAVAGTTTLKTGDYNALVDCHNGLHEVLAKPLELLDTVRREVDRIRDFHSRMHRRTQAAESREIKALEQFYRTIEAKAKLGERLKIFKASKTGKLAQVLGHRL